MKASSLEWLFPKTWDWLGKLITFDWLPRLLDSISSKNEETPSSHEGFWKRKEILKYSSPFYSSNCEIWLPCTLSLLRFESERLGRSRDKWSWRWDGKGWMVSESDSRLKLWEIISSCRMELLFTKGFMNHFEIFFIGSKSWKKEGGREYGLGIWFADLPTLFHWKEALVLGLKKEEDKEQKE